MKLYQGVIPAAGYEVQVIENGTSRLLDPRYDLANHSPDGFAWGYGGSGPSQLALALLADALSDDQRACAIYQDFKWEIIARLPEDESWAMTANIIRVLVRKCELRRAQHDAS